MQSKDDLWSLSHSRAPSVVRCKIVQITHRLARAIQVVICMQVKEAQRGLAHAKTGICILNTSAIETILGP